MFAGMRINNFLISVITLMLICFALGPVESVLAYDPGTGGGIPDIYIPGSPRGPGPGDSCEGDDDDEGETDQGGKNGTLDLYVVDFLAESLVDEEGEVFDHLGLAPLDEARISLTQVFLSDPVADPEVCESYTIVHTGAVDLAGLIKLAFYGKSQVDRFSFLKLELDEAGNLLRKVYVTVERISEVWDSQVAFRLEMITENQ